MGYPSEVRFEVYEAIMEYAESGTLIELKPMAKMAFSIFKVEIDMENERQRDISAKRAEAGRKAMEARYSKDKQDVTNLTNANKSNKCYQVLDLQENPSRVIDNNILNNNIYNLENKETTTKVVEKKKEKSAAKAAPSPIEARKDAFYESLKPFLGKYPKEMLRKFFDYWSEMNKSHTKMRFELERTWEVSKRLVTWSNRNKDFSSPTDIGVVLKDNSTDKYQNEEKWNR